MKARQNQNKRPSMALQEEGKLPPQALDMEQAVLSACLVDPECVSDLSAFLLPEHFYLQANKLIFEAILADRAAGSVPNLLTVVERLRSTGELESVGGAFYVAQLSSKAGSSANVEVHARIIQECYIRRTVIADCHITSAEAYDTRNDVFDVVDAHDNRMAAVRAITNAPEPRSMFEVMGKIIDNTKPELYIHFGFAPLDQHVAMGPGCIVVIGARPSVGKTTFVINALTNIAKAGHRSLFISLEMNEVQLTAKVASAYTGIDSERITRNEIDLQDRERIGRAMNENAVWLDRIKMDHVPTVHASHIAGLMHRAKERYGCEVVVIDYVQLMEGDGDNGVERMSNISKACKRAAIATGLRLIEVSQLKRRDGAETAPLMSDLREAGQLEADGDIILMLGRAKGDGTLNVFIEKNKMGPTGAEQLPFDLMTQRIGGAYVNANPPAFNTRLPASNPDRFTEPSRDEHEPF